VSNVHLPLAADAELPSASLPYDGRRKAIQPADVRGRFHRARRLVLAVLLVFWATLPWVKLRGHPAIFLDVDAREFFLFGSTFNAQDTWMLFFVLTGIGFALVCATALAGRVWCGWACPQTVFLEGIFRPIERLVEGSREKRIRRNSGPWTADRIARKALKQALFVLSAFLVAHIFLSYFVSIPKTFAMVRQSPSRHPEAFAWAVAMTAIFYVNFAWFREQLCVVICPYGRLQSAMLDERSLIVGYDARRGEPRGHIRSRSADASKAWDERRAMGTGDCVDCRRCVVVCPTGIDIRNGTQMECLACTACIDACDEVMDKLGRPRGLVRYDSQDGLAGKPRIILRPRLYIYGVLLLLGLAVAAIATGRRRDFEVAMLRLPGEPYAVEAGQVRNMLQLHVVNKRSDRTSFLIDVDPAPDMTAVVPMTNVSLPPLSDMRVPVIVSVPRDRVVGDFPVRVRVARADDLRDVTLVTAPFLGPSR
jgi:cytochrome c oxidase accessory protein FixG